MMKEEFLKKLKDLLEEYNVVIGFEVNECSDTYGLSGERMVISQITKGAFKEDVWLTIDGWGLDHTDIK